MRRTIVLGIITAVLAAVTVAWTPVLLPKLEQLPTDFSTEVDVAGTATVAALPGTLARLPQPVVQPLSGSVVIASVSSANGDLVLSQTETQAVGAAGGPTQQLALKSQYVLDRHTTQNVNDPSAWSITPSHAANRGGTYSFVLGFDFDPNSSYPFWDDSIAASYPLTRVVNPGPVNSQGLAAVTAMAGSVTNAPADPVWIAALTPLNLPTSLTPEQWNAAGFQVPATQPQVAADYFVSIQVQFVIDDLTGGTVSLNQETLAIAVAPAGSTAPPLTVLTNAFAETAPSIATDVALISAAGQKLTLAQTTIPRVLIGLTILFAIATVTTFVLGRRRAARAADTGVTEDT